MWKFANDVRKNDNNFMDIELYLFVMFLATVCIFFFFFQNKSLNCRKQRFAEQR